MITFICLFWIGAQMSAPLLYFLLLSVGIGLKLFDSISQAKLNRRVREHLD